MENQLSQWLKETCRKEHLSLRQAGERAGLSHSTVHAIVKGGHASAETVTRLARGFAGDGINQRQVLEDRLLVLAGYRTEQPGEKLSEPLAQLIDKVQKFDEPQIKMMLSFADFLVEIDGRGRNEC